MSKRRNGTAALAGCAGFALAVVLAVAAAPETAPTQGRYQLHVYEQHPGGNSLEAGSYGAFRIDTVSGEVFRIDGSSRNTSKVTFEGGAR